MKLSSLFSPKPTHLAGKRLYAAAAAQARQPALYERLGAPDTVEGRFELYTLHVGMILRRLKGQGGEAADTAQALFDTYVSALDDALREMGVGDLAVGKKMRKLGEAFYGRVKNYDEAFGLLPDRTSLEAILQRTVLAGEGRRSDALADYAVVAMDGLERQPLDAFLKGDAQWPPI